MAVISSKHVMQHDVSLAVKVSLSLMKKTHKTEQALQYSHHKFPHRGIQYWWNLGVIIYIYFFFLKDLVKKGLNLSDSEQSSSVAPEQCSIVQHRLNPSSNLGYLAVISLAHCLSDCCCAAAWWALSYNLSLILPLHKTHCKV